MDLRPRGAGPDIRFTDPDGPHDVHPAENVADLGRSPPGEDDARHDVRLHVFVPESAVGARPVLDGVQCFANRPAVVDDPSRARARWARGQRRRPRLIRRPLALPTPVRDRSARAFGRRSSRNTPPAADSSRALQVHEISGFITEMAKITTACRLNGAGMDRRESVARQPAIPPGAPLPPPPPAPSRLRARPSRG